MLMTGNTAIASIPLLFAVIPALGWWTLGGWFVWLLIYLEYWRIFCARNLRHQLAIEAACQENENIFKVSTMQTVPTRPIWETIVEIGAQIPDKAWATVPDDASINYKHYLYGVLKKQS